MNNENEVMEKAPVLTKKDCVKGAIRWSLMAVTTFNYDTQLAPAVVFGIGPLLRKIYKDDDEYVEALNNQLLNTSTPCHGWQISFLVLLWLWKTKRESLPWMLYRISRSA